jgi:hypothetical protein
MMSSTLGCTLTGDLPGTNIFLKTETTRNHLHQNILVTQTQVKLSTSNKLLTYKTILNTLQLWSTASISAIEILECFQLKALRVIEEAPQYVPNMVIRRNLQTPRVKEEISHYSSQCSAHLSTHPSTLLVNHMKQTEHNI